MECFIGKPYFYVVFFPENFFSRAFFIVPCDIFLAEAFVEQACRSLGQEFAKVLESVCPSSALVMVNSFMVSSCIEKNSSRFFNWCRFGAAGISPPPDARTSEPFLRVVLLLNKTDNKSRQTTDRGESFILTFRVTPSSQYPPPLTWSPSL